jgi:hypothetical protein
MTAITSRSEPALAASPAVHASSKSITGASTLLEVQRVLQEEFKLPSDVALSIATAFRNSGAGVTSGVQLMKTLRTYGPEAFRWIYNGIRHKNGVADKISTIDNYLSLWRAHCSDITHVRHMADGWIQVRHENERSVKFPQGMYYKPQWSKTRWPTTDQLYQGYTGVGGTQGTHGVGYTGVGGTQGTHRVG